MANSARARSTCAAGALGERLRRVKAIRSSGESGRRGSVWWRDMEYLGSTRITPSLYQSSRQVTHSPRRNAFEFLRDHAAEHYAAHTGSAWRPRSGSMVNHRTLTAAMIDSRDFLNAKRRAETEVLLPPGPRIAFAGGVDYNDHARIWAALDQAREKHPAMVLMHG